jgi:chromosome segregation ATPase
MSSQSNIVVASPAGEDFLAFQRDFDEHLSKLSDALAKSQSVGSKASDIEKKGTLSMVWGSINGDNDKEFAQMASQLAASLETTQVVLQIVMQLSHRKNGFLKQFHQVLVNKISGLATDTKTLDRNQREATIVVLEEIQNHVAAQLEQQDMVERHEARLNSLDEYIDAADIQEGEFRNSLLLLDARSRALHEAEAELRGLIAEQAQRIGGVSQDIADARSVASAQQERMQHLQERDEKQSVAFEQQRTRIEEHERRDAERQRRVADLANLVAAQGARLDVLEAHVDEQRARIDEEKRRNEALVQETAELKDLLTASRAQIDGLASVVSEWKSPKAVLLRYGWSIAALTLAAASLMKVWQLH